MKTTTHLKKLISSLHFIPSFLHRLFGPLVLFSFGFLLYACGSDSNEDCDRLAFQDALAGSEVIEIQEIPEKQETEEITIVGQSLGKTTVAGPGLYHILGRVTAVFDVNKNQQIDPNELPLSPNTKTGDLDPYLIFTGVKGQIIATLRFNQTEGEANDYDLFAFSLEEDGECGFFVNFDDEVTQSRGATKNQPEQIEVTLQSYTPYMFMVQGFAGEAGDYEIDMTIE